MFSLLFNIAMNLSNMANNVHEKFLFLNELKMVQLTIWSALVILILQKYPITTLVAVFTDLITFLIYIELSIFRNPISRKQHRCAAAIRRKAIPGTMPA